MIFINCIGELVIKIVIKIIFKTDRKTDNTISKIEYSPNAIALTTYGENSRKQKVVVFSN